MKQFSGFVFFAFLVTNCFAQFFESGQDPASIKWRQINTPQVQIIFPLGFDSAANRLANTFGYIYLQGAESLNSKPRKISVLLHSTSSISNGFVTLAPRRMELYTTPPQNFTAQNWLSELAVHEYRHVAQIDKLNTGFAKGLYYVLGEQGTGMVTGLLPRWFLEGDAVYAETALTSSGRGRTGNFTMEIKSLVSEQEKLFSFEKMLLGSYKDYVPDHYHSGYFLVSSIRKDYGVSVFEKSITYVARKPYIPFSFSAGLKRETGKTARKLYNEAFLKIKQITNIENTGNTYSGYSTWGKPLLKLYTSFNYPQQISETAIVTAKSGIGEIQKFVQMDKYGYENTIYIPGNYRNTRFSYKQGKLAWSEEIPDTRWSNRSYSCIRIFDIKTGKLSKLTKKTRYFAAALSGNSSQLATVEVSVQNTVSLIVLDAITGKITYSYPSPNNLMISDPVFSTDNRSVIAILTGDRGKAIYSCSLPNGTWEQITPFVFYTLSCPVEWRENILFSADFTGKNAIYAYSLKKQAFYQIIPSKNGAFEPFIAAHDSVVFYTDYTSNGFSVKTNTIDPHNWVKTEISPVYTDSFIKPAADSENFNFQDSSIFSPGLNNRTGTDSVNYVFASKPYRRLPHLFKLHSWAPFYFDYSNLSAENKLIYPGLSLLSQNITGTGISSLSLLYSENTWFLKPRFVYKGWYPVIDISANYGGNIPYNAPPNTHRSPLPETGRVTIHVLLYVPLNLTRGKYITNLTPYFEINYDNKRFFYSSDSSFKKGVVYTGMGISLHKYLRTSLRDIAPRFGFSFNSKYTFTPLNRSQFGWTGYIRPRLYLPGPLPHHSLIVTATMQAQEPKQFYLLFSSQVPFARGYETSLSYTFKSIWFDYHFPLFYPDLTVGPLVYVKRIRGNLFFDLAKNDYKIYSNNFISYQWVSRNYKSLGVELLSDIHLFRIFFPITTGLRMVYMSDEKVLLNQFILRIDFNF